MKFVFFICPLVLTSFAFAYRSPDWSEGAFVPDGGRANIYEWSHRELEEKNHRGLVHSIHYPVPTGLSLPYRPIKNLIEAKSRNPLKQVLLKGLNRLLPFKSFDQMQAWMGLHSYPQKQSKSQFKSSPYYLPETRELRLGLRVGMTVRASPLGEILTASCLACHSAKLFGQNVVGLSNRFPRANEFFFLGQKNLARAPLKVLKWFSGASQSELSLFTQSKKTLRSIGIKTPIALGLDTSLAQVSLSLAKRARDPWASFDRKAQKSPHFSRLNDLPADSKPSVWWNLKYKNKWLSDGSLVSGNPILTNFLWNEIGRGADLRKLEAWLIKNSSIVEELTTAVFNSQPPSIFDFFEEKNFDVASVKRGQQVYRRHCARCHGIYLKSWNFPHQSTLVNSTTANSLKTLKVIYHANTPPMNVGTDPWRYRGMKELEILNELSFSKKFGMLVRPQKGYLPPPLVGIWARWPYLHNNSVATLAELLKPTKLRRKTFWMRPANDKENDFDIVANGYPQGQPKNYRLSPRFLFNTRVLGASNAGHDLGIISGANGKSLLSEKNRKDLVLYLQTL